MKNYFLKYNFSSWGRRPSFHDSFPSSWTSCLMIFGARESNIRLCLRPWRLVSMATTQSCFQLCGRCKLNLSGVETWDGFTINVWTNYHERVICEDIARSEYRNSSTKYTKPMIGNLCRSWVPLHTPPCPAMVHYHLNPPTKCKLLLTISCKCGSEDDVKEVCVSLKCSFHLPTSWYTNTFRQCCIYSPMNATRFR